MNLSRFSHTCPTSLTALTCLTVCLVFQSLYATDAFSQDGSDSQRMRIRQLLLRRARAGQDGQGAGAPGSQRMQGQGNASGPKAQAALASIDPEKVTLKRDIKYGELFNQDLDVYSPAKSKTLSPMLIFAHGGGWSRGDKTNGHVDKGIAWAENGVVFASINYRLAPSVTHPKQIQDMAQAFAFLKKHATEYGADPARIYLMGHSAGAHLVDLLGTNGRFLAEQKLSLKDIRGVISLDTASLNLADRLTDPSPESKLVGGMVTTAFGSDPAVLADASPTSSIRAGVAYPSFLMFCGEKRKNCVAQHAAFSAAFNKAGGKVVVQPVPLSHSEISLAAGQPSSEIFQKSLAFVKTQN